MHRRRRGPRWIFAPLIFWAILALTWMALRTREVPVLLITIFALLAGFMFAFRRASSFFRAQDRLRRQLMADVAHELRTPLAVLQGRIEGLIDGVYPRNDAQLESLHAQTQHLSRLVGDLRTIANAEAGALDLRKEPVDIAALIRDTAFANVAVEVPDDMPLINVDPVRIREVLLNLLSNAVRYGNATIRAQLQPKRIVIQVIDDGPGIPPDELPRIFDRFRKGSDSAGSGLGLAIAKTLVTAHGGTIDVASTAGKGTTVTVSIPR